MASFDLFELFALFSTERIFPLLFIPNLKGFMPLFIFIVQLAFLYLVCGFWNTIFKTKACGKSSKEIGNTMSGSLDLFCYRIVEIR